MPAVQRVRVREQARILVVRLGAIGDVLRVLPAVRRLRVRRPDVSIAWAVEDWVYPLLADNPNIDRFHVLQRNALRCKTWKRSMFGLSATSGYTQSSTAQAMETSGRRTRSRRTAGKTRNTSPIATSRTTSIRACSFTRTRCTAGIQ